MESSGPKEGEDQTNLAHMASNPELLFYRKVLEQMKRMHQDVVHSGEDPGKIYQSNSLLHTQNSFGSKSLLEGLWGLKE